MAVPLSGRGGGGKEIGMDFAKLKELMSNLEDQHELMEEGFDALQAINNSNFASGKAYGFAICQLNCIFLDAKAVLRELSDMVKAAEKAS